MITRILAMIEAIRWMPLIAVVIQSNDILQANDYCLDQQRHNYCLCPCFVLYKNKYIFKIYDGIH
jgi:hypothetical protein